MKEKVSMIIPCYNGAKTIDRCLDSILMQDYPTIEVIVVNDGSKDDSSAHVKSYIERFASHGLELRLIEQENKGLAGAINAGLAVFTGAFLCWFDCDDYLLPGSVRKRVEFLNARPDIAVVTSDAYYYKEDDLEHPVRKASDGLTDLHNPYQFENHLRSKAIFCCGCHMVRTEAFLEAVPSRSIYPARRGQNWQMLLPVYYRFKQDFLDEPLYAYILYASSMSAGDTTEEQYRSRYDGYYDIIRHTLQQIDMPDSEQKKYMSIYEGIYARQCFYMGVSFHNFKALLKNMMRMICLGEWNSQDSKWAVNIIKNQFKRRK